MRKPVEVDDLYRLRHSTAHVLAQAVQHLFPEARMTIGPATDEGFYYDFDRDTPFTPGNTLIKQANPQMSDELLAYGVRKMREYNIVGGGNAMTSGIMTMTDDRWLTTVEFLRVTGMAKPNVDYRKAWTTDIVKDMRVLP
jgi:hypothetical protein